MATYIGTIYNDVYTGSAQNQYGIDGADFLSPSSDNKAYYLYGGNGNDDLYGFSFNDELYGGSGKDLIVGLNGNDYIEGGSGNDMLYGSYGNDELSGGRGRDIFVFDTQLSSKNNLDTITDYDTSKDLIDLDKAIFTKVGKVDHTLKSNKFVVGNKAKDSKDRIIYNDDNGVLKYDPDGNGSKSAKKFAILNSDLDMSHDDFFVI